MKKTNDYIERDEAIITINKYRIGLRKQGLVILDGAVAEVKKRIDNLPNADVRPVVRGKWEHGREIARKMWGNETWEIEYEDWHCSACGCVVKDYGFSRYKFCPFCGADMRGDKDE